MKRIWRRTAMVTAFLSIAAAIALVTLILVRRARTGKWEAPNREDVQAIRETTVVAVTKAKDRLLGKPPPISRVIFLNGRGANLMAGTDDASRSRSSVIGTGTKTQVTVPAWSGSRKNWKRVVACVDNLFKEYDVTVTDERPNGESFMMAVVGGRSKDIGVIGGHVGGLAPFSGEPIPRAVVFAFSRTLGNRVQATCETLGMEIAHAYGLDHAYHCPDVMTYLRGCGKKRFRNREVRCGEKKKRDCKGGESTQNSVARLLRILGPRKVQ